MAAPLGGISILMQRCYIIDIDIIVNRKRDLFEIVGALCAARRLPCGLDGRQKKSDQDGDDRDDDQELDQRECPSVDWITAD